jgi:hypothetical protein
MKIEDIVLSHDVAHPSSRNSPFCRLRLQQLHYPFHPHILHFQHLSWNSGLFLQRPIGLIGWGDYNYQFIPCGDQRYYVSILLRHWYYVEHGRWRHRLRGTTLRAEHCCIRECNSQRATAILWYRGSGSQFVSDTSLYLCQSWTSQSDATLYICTTPSPLTWLVSIFRHARYMRFQPAMVGDSFSIPRLVQPPHGGRLHIPLSGSVEETST